MAMDIDRHDGAASTGESPASQAMSKAIEMAIAEESPFPEKALFLNADVPREYRESEMARAASDGMSIVLVSPDLTAQVIPPDEILKQDAAA